MLSSSTRLLSSATKSRVISNQLRSIAVGTDLTTSSLSWQAARPWHMDGTSNKAVDNALSMEDVFANKTVAVFGVPAPFTGTCTNAHYPPFKAMADDFAKAGVDSLICYTVSDPYALMGWGKSLENDFDKISFVADPDASWAKENDLDRDYNDASLGVRSERFSMLVKDGIVQSFHIVKDADKDAETLLADVKKL